MKMNVKTVLKINNLFITCLLLLVLVPLSLLAAEDDYPNDYLRDISDANISLLCKTESFIKLIALSKSSCAIKLKTYSKRCNEIIKPLVPTLDDERSMDVLGKIFGNLAILHLSCIKAESLELVEEKPRRKPRGQTP